MIWRISMQLIRLTAKPRQPRPSSAKPEPRRANNYSYSPSPRPPAMTNTSYGKFPSPSKIMQNTMPTFSNKKFEDPLEAMFSKCNPGY